jgi:hypothetical protein
MAGQKAKGSRKGRKIGRNEAYCKRYVAMELDAKHKLRRMRRHIRKTDYTDLAAMALFKTAGGTDDYLRSLQ